MSTLTGQETLKANVISRDGRHARAGKPIRARARIGWCNRIVVRWLDTGESEGFTMTQFNKRFRAYQAGSQS